MLHLATAACCLPRLATLRYASPPTDVLHWSARLYCLTPITCLLPSLCSYLEEVSSCNIFVVKGKTIRTPPLKVRAAQGCWC